MKFSKRFMSMGVAVIMAVSMMSMDVNAYGTYKFTDILAQSESYNRITTTKNYSVDYCYGVLVTSIKAKSGYCIGVPKFRVKTGNYSDWVEVWHTNNFYTFDSSVCKGKKTYYGDVINSVPDCKCIVSGEFRYM